MKNDKIVYIPEVVYTPSRVKPKRKDASKADINKAAVLAATALLALSAAGKGDAYISSTEKPKPVTYMQKSPYASKAPKVYPVKRAGQRIDIKETSAGTFVNMRNEKKTNNSELGAFLFLSGMAMAMSGLVLASMNKSKQSRGAGTQNASIDYEYQNAPLKTFFTAEEVKTDVVEVL